MDGERLKNVRMMIGDLPDSPCAFAAIRRGVAICLFLGLGVLGALQAQDGGVENSGRNESPDPSSEENFADLIGNSPFLRRVDLSRSLVLTGVAEIEGDPFAILFDRDTDESHFVTGEKNSQGWQLLGIDGDFEDLTSVTARVSVTGGEVISIGYDIRQIKPGSQIGLDVPKDHAASVAEEARNYRRGLSADGFPRLPPKDLMEKLSKMSESQRGRIIYQMRQLRSKGVGGDERQKIFRGLVDRASLQRR